MFLCCSLSYFFSCFLFSLFYPVVVPQEHGGTFFPRYIFLASTQFASKIISNVLRLVKRWQFQHTNGKLVHASHTFFTFPIENCPSPPPLPTQIKCWCWHHCFCHFFFFLIFPSFCHHCFFYFFPFNLSFPFNIPPSFLLSFTLHPSLYLFSLFPLSFCSYCLLYFPFLNSPPYASCPLPSYSLHLYFAHTKNKGSKKALKLSSQENS